MKTVKKENERVLRAQEELNQILNYRVKEKINRQDPKTRPTNIKVKSPNSQKLKVVCPLKFMVIHTGRISSTLAIAVKITTNIEKEHISLMRKFQKNLRR